MSAKFEVINHPNYNQIRLPKVAETEGAKAFEAQLDTLLSQHPHHAIIECEGILDFNPAWLGALLRLHGRLEAIEKQLRLVQVSEALANRLKAAGVNGKLKVAAGVKAALTEMGAGGIKVLDVNFINPFLIAAVKVLETQSSTKAKAGTIYKRAPRDRFLGDISGVIGLVSEAFTGSVVISFPAPTFLKIMSRMLGEDLTEITKEIEDGAGEITNIIFGQAKIGLNERGFGIKTALPSVITGTDHSIIQMSNGPRVVVPFETDVGPFFVEICLSA